MVSKAGIVKRSREAERRLAFVVGGKRNPATGSEGKPDVETEEEAFELKSLESLPAWLHEAWEQAVRQGAHVGKKPILVLEERRSGGQNVRYYVVDEKRWLKNWGHGPDRKKGHDPG